MVPVRVAKDDLPHLAGIDPEVLQLIGDRREVLCPGFLVVLGLLPAAVGENDFIAALDYAHVHGQVDSVYVVHRLVATGHKGAIRHEGAVWHAHEPADFDGPDRAKGLGSKFGRIIFV